MADNGYKPLIDRSTSVEAVQAHFSRHIEVLQDMSNYGSNLIPRCLTSSNRRLEDAIILGVLLRQAIAMFDAIEILISNAAIYPCYLQLRAIFESSLYIEWILKTETEKRAKYYYVANVRKERVWANRTQKGSPENIAYEKIMAPFGDAITDTTQQLSDEGKMALQEINRVLAQDSFSGIDQAIDSFKTKNKYLYDPPWYAPLGPKTVRQLADNLGRIHEYELIYSESSAIMHSASHKHHIKFLKGRLKFIPIRYLKGIQNLLRFSMATMIKIYSDVISHYRSSEKPNFHRKYREDWRKEFMGIPEVKYADENEINIVI